MVVSSHSSPDRVTLPSRPPRPVLPQTSAFWDLSHFILNDALNQEVWRDSKRMHESICWTWGENPGDPEPRAAGRAFPLGPLPWVPDLVGKDWPEDEDGLLICEPACLGLTAPGGAPNCGYSLDEYASQAKAHPLDCAEPLASLWRHLGGTKAKWNHYDRLGAFLEDKVQILPESVALMHLVRAPAVLRPANDSGPAKGVDRRLDKYAGIVNSGNLFVRSGLTEQQMWLWRRINESRVRRIVAFGRVAEHGLLRLFLNVGLSCFGGCIRIRTFRDRGVRILARRYVAADLRRLAPHTWVPQLAASHSWCSERRKLDYWLREEDFWSITLGSRVWYVLPMQHPADWTAAQDGRGYAAILRTMLAMPKTDTRPLRMPSKAISPRPTGSLPSTVWPTSPRPSAAGIPPTAPSAATPGSEGGSPACKSPTAAPKPKPVAKSRDFGLTLAGIALHRMVWIPAGSFVMGSVPIWTKRRTNVIRGVQVPEEYEEEAPADELPVTEVSLPGFWMSQTPVTLAAYNRVTGKFHSVSRGDRDLVGWVTWFDAMEYCEALSRKTGKACTLPTEAQWEYACRAGVRDQRDHSADETASADAAQPNGWGLCDMGGTVREWCLSKYWPYPYRDGDGRNLMDRSDDERILRGGRPGARGHASLKHRMAFYGFRVVCNLVS